MPSLRAAKPLNVLYRERQHLNHRECAARTPSGVALGSVVITRDGYIKNFRVNPAFRGQGIGRELLNRLISHEATPQRVWLHALAGEGHQHQRKLERFYTSLGFVSQGSDAHRGTVMELNRADFTVRLIAAYCHRYTG